MRGRLFRLVIMICLSILVISGCKETVSQPTDDWNTYENEKYGYSFMYPPDCFYGPLPGECKQKPPEERGPECLCFLNGENPDQVSLEKMIVEADTVTGGVFSISHYDTPIYNPPPGTDLIQWLEEEYFEMLEDVPSALNIEISGIPAASIYFPSSPMAPSYEEIFYIKDDVLFRINMLDVDNEGNKDLYDHILSTFDHSD
jgi:hypothetical protein